MTIHTKNGYGPCITDHHDVTEEDMHYASLGNEEEMFWADFYAPSIAYRRREPFKGRSAEWMRRFNASKLGGPKE